MFKLLLFQKPISTKSIDNHYKRTRLWYQEAREYINFDLKNDLVFPVPIKPYKSNSDLPLKYLLDSEERNDVLKLAIEKFNKISAIENVSRKKIFFEILDKNFTNPGAIQRGARKKVG